MNLCSPLSEVPDARGNGTVHRRRRRIIAIGTADLSQRIGGHFRMNDMQWNRVLEFPDPVEDLPFETATEPSDSEVIVF